MFKKVLIANRGAIASRIIRTLKQMGIISVAVYHETDIDSQHVALADETYSLGDGRATDTYLNQDKLLAIMKQANVEAVHPGYGFLSENPDFVKRCEENNICFVGPTIEQMQAFGLKHSARRLAKDNKVPLLPGTELLKDLSQAIIEAEHIGYPVMLKSTAGGGGIGMQLCHSAEELKKSYDSVKQLSENNFSNSGVFLEKYIEYARHIEVQIFGDGEGKAIAIGERDCSAQRRNQKVIEEAPAPNISNEVRNKLYETSVRLVEAVKYRNAGTVEFIYDQQDQEFYFLEVNTRLQVEHGVTEQVYQLDLVQLMLKQAANELNELPTISKPTGHAIQTRIYAENPYKDFQPSAGLLSHVTFPESSGLRIEHWLDSGLEVSPLFDPMLAKVIVTAADRQAAITKLSDSLKQVTLYGIETNINYVLAVLQTETFQEGKVFTRYLNNFVSQQQSIDVLSAGTMTTIQDYPGRIGYWDVGVPPSGPFDSYAFRLGNRLLDNQEEAAGLEITLNGPSLQFNCDTQIVLTGAEMEAHLDNKHINFYQVTQVKAGQVLNIAKPIAAGARSYLLIKDGIKCPDYLGSRSTFTLGQFGGHVGRALRAGDVLHISESHIDLPDTNLTDTAKPKIKHKWQLRVIYGPHGAPDFFTDKDITTFFDSEWEVHYNSSRTGIRLIGPKPDWARSDGGEAGMHPSNIHDNAYAIGTVDFTGDMPVILGPDGPSLGGFVCPATVVTADLWKLGQLKAGDKVSFMPISLEDAVQLEKEQNQAIAELSSIAFIPKATPITTTILHTSKSEKDNVDVVYRPAGDHYLLVEFGPLVLDIELRFRVHALMLHLEKLTIHGIQDLTPGIRSLQIHYDSQVLPLKRLMSLLNEAQRELTNIAELEVPARVIHLPLSWNDDACQLAIDKYMQSVRKDAPWCPSNIEFIRRINGLESIDQVKDIVFNASYLVMGLGDVYLGAPVATPMDPRHRLVTTKYNPARTWTAENSVGIGGAYMCVYGMEGPGGYQFVGRTLQMWNRYHITKEFDKPWLLEFFDQIQFYEVSAEELKNIRQDFPRGRYSLDIEHKSFKLKDYQNFLENNADSINQFSTKRQQAFDNELQRWIESGQINFSTESLVENLGEEQSIPENCVAIESTVAGNVWKLLVNEGDVVEKGQVLLVLESMKMEIEILAPQAGKIYSLIKSEGSQVNAGQALIVLEEMP